MSIPTYCYLLIEHISSGKQGTVSQNQIEVFVQDKTTFAKSNEGFKELKIPISKVHSICIVMN